MSNPLRDRKSRPLMILGVVLAVVGIVGMRADGVGVNTAWPMITTAASLPVIFLAAWLHDRSHRSRGEKPHALWGRRSKG
ncbi:hypothetical protein [Kineococcus sp. SYSU DK005]|uniref:hypothetical protein n=1 Tax=Kineococcus sp. SYSU DK005 TaxID=3383126 RepID=UPI003D7E8E39